MYNTNILDSNRLINLKNQHGLRIATGNSVSVYSYQSKLRKMLTSAFSSCLHKIDLETVVDKIVDRCEDIETVEAVTTYFNAVSTQEFLKEAQGKIRPFFKMVRNFNPLSTEFTGQVQFSA